MTLTSQQKWLRTIAWLRREFPTQHKAHVRSCVLCNLDGDAFFLGMWFKIRINRKKSLAIKLDTLIHEWAHCLTWFGAEQLEDHSDEWGLQYAKIYRAYLDWNFGRTE